MAEQWFRHKWLDAIYASELDPTTRHVAEIFAGKARQDSVVWEPISNLMHKTGRAKNTCRKARQTLVDGGWLTEVKAPTHKTAAHFLLVIPTSEGVNHCPPKEDEGGQPLTLRGSTTDPQGVNHDPPRGSTTDPSQSVVNPDQSILSPEQLLVRDLLGLDDGDERLMKVPQLLADKSPDTPKPWLRGCHRNGDLLDLLEKVGTTTSGWGTETTDERMMPNPSYIEGTNAPEVNIEDWHRARMQALGLQRDEMDGFFDEARRNYPNGKLLVLWREALMNAQHDVKENPRCEECGCRLDHGHYRSCSHATQVRCDECSTETGMAYRLGLTACPSCSHKRQILKETA